MSQPLSACLAEGQGYLPHYKNALANHAPMALTALDLMGADEARLRRFFDRYKTRLTAFEPKPPRLWTNWSDALGDRSAFPDLLAHFEATIERDGVDRTLTSVLPILMPGIGASAFHGVIRTAYGVRASNSAEIAHGLAYWAADYLWFGSIQAASSASMAQLLQRHSKAFLSHQYGPGIIADRMKEIARRTDFADMPQQPENIDWAALLSLAGHAYSATGNFTLLHGLTGAHALLGLRPWLTQPDQALRYYWLALLLAFVTSREAPSLGAVAESAIAEDTARDWALDQVDDHDIKLVWTCLDLVQQLPEHRKIWLAAIERRLAGRQEALV